MFRLQISILLFTIFFCKNTFASDSLSVNKTRKQILLTSTIGVSSGSLLYLNQVWYKQYHHSQFHFFNDNTEWLQMDKCGHLFTTYQTTRLMMNSLQWAGYNTKKQKLYSGLSGFTYMTAVELMDGYSTGWGFSWGDMIANSLGTGIAIAQKIKWNEQRIQIKFSYYPSHYANYNTNLLGKSIGSQILKDYNAQTYWLSINPSSFFKPNNNFPKWLNIAFGYGANGMINAKGNTIFIPFRQSYLSLDVDFTRIKTKSKICNYIFSCINILKLPFPNIEFSKHKLTFNYY